MIRIGILNGPNLNLLGEREPGVYGLDSLDEINRRLEDKYKDVRFSFFQSNVEGELINTLQEWQGDLDGIIINPGGYSHTSIALADCLAVISIPTIEVHISNIHKRETYRHHTITGAQADGIIAGFGAAGYEIATDALLKILSGFKH